MAAKSPEAKMVEDEMSMYRQLEAQQNWILQNRTSSISQMRENEMVRDELDRLDEEAPVFKLVGPVLMRQVGDAMLSFVGGPLFKGRVACLNCSRRPTSLYSGT